MGHQIASLENLEVPICRPRPEFRQPGSACLGKCICSARSAGPVTSVRTLHGHADVPDERNAWRDAWRDARWDARRNARGNACRNAGDENAEIFLVRDPPICFAMCHHHDMAVATCKWSSVCIAPPWSHNQKRSKSGSWTSHGDKRDAICSLCVYCIFMFIDISVSLYT